MACNSQGFPGHQSGSEQCQQRPLLLGWHFLLDAERPSVGRGSGCCKLGRVRWSNGMGHVVYLRLYSGKHVEARRNSDMVGVA